MNVCIIGNAELDWKIDDLHRLVKNYIYPHDISAVYTTNEEGTAASARLMAEKYNLQCIVLGSRFEAIESCDMTIALRKDTDYPAEIRYAARKNKLFKEFVLTT